MVDRVAVGDLSRHGRAWLVAVDGSGVVETDDVELVHGWGLPYPEPFTGAYAQAGKVWFQAGARRWDAASIATVQQVKDRLRLASYRLTFLDGTQHVIEVKLPLAVVSHKLIDPTYDEIESLSDDPMKLLPYIAEDGWHAGDTDVAAWAQRVLGMWSAGVPVRPSR